MEKWIFVNNITSLDKLYYLTKTISENEITEDNHSLILMNALNENGANRNEANNHPINYTLFYNMTYLDGSVYKLTSDGINLLNNYNKMLSDKKYKAEFFFEILNKIKYPNVAVETTEAYKIHPFNIIFRLLCEKRLDNYITIDEFENILSIAHEDSDYEKLVGYIIKYRNGEKIELNCEKIAQVSTVVAGWSNQFNVMKRNGERIMLSDDLQSMLPVLSNERIISKIPYSSEFISFVIKRYLFDGASMSSIENEYYHTDDRRGFLVKDVLDYFQINNEQHNKAIYNNKDINFVCSLLDIQSDVRYKTISDAIRDKHTNVESSNENTTILEKFIKYYDENISRIKRIENVASDELRQEFLIEYPLEKFKSMQLREYSMGLGDNSTFCAKVENGKYKNYGVKCSGFKGAGHWGIFFKEDKQVYLDSEYNVIENPENYWFNFKNELYNFLVNLNSNNPKFSDSYPLLKKMDKTLPKLCFMYYPQKFANFVTKERLQELYDLFGLEYNSSTVADKLSYDLNEYIRKNVPNAKNEMSEYIALVLEEFKEYLSQEDKSEEIIEVSGGYNKIYYGVPGCGKSYKVREDFKKEDYKIETTTFHPEYTNSDFIGQIIPKLEGEKVIYEFHPGAFALSLLYALQNPSKKTCLVIEEINRGNASAIFGDIFQLLDRDESGKSRYTIFNGPLINFLKDNKIEIGEIYIPSNMWIIATMNTSDQNVFTLDTAFKRRWKMEYIKNEFANDAESKKLKETLIPTNKEYTMITWEKFVDRINYHLLADKSGINGEDKQLGKYFVTVEEINDTKEFAEKVLSYLWDDVAKINKSYWFGGINSYEELLKKYDEEYLNVFDRIFVDDIKKKEESMVNTDTSVEEG